MALKATIIKVQVQLSDLDRHLYDTINLTIAQHPSETNGRLMVRLVAYLFNVHPDLQFTKGLCADDEPAAWQVAMNDDIDNWIDLGIPDERRVRKACNRAKQVMIYVYGGGDADIWWQRNASKFQRFNNLIVYRLINEQITSLTALVKRSMQLQCTIQDGELWLSDDQQAVHVVPQRLG